jgi:hypothetical protein
MNGGLRAIATFVPKERKNCICIMAYKLNTIFMLKRYRKNMTFGPWPLSIFYTKIRKKKNYFLHEDKKEEEKIKQFGARYLLVYRVRNLKFGKNFAEDGIEAHSSRC